MLKRIEPGVGVAITAGIRGPEFLDRGMFTGRRYSFIDESGHKQNAK